MPTSGPELARKYDRLKARRLMFDNLYDDLAEFEAPHRGRPSYLAQHAQTPGERQTDRLFDSTAVEAAAVLAANMQGALSSPTLPWFRLKTRDDRLNQIKSVQDWLEHAEQAMLLALRQSNFYAEAMEGWLDLAVFGTKCLYIGERDAAGGAPWGGLLFRSHPVGSYVIDEGPDGLVDTIMREQQMSARVCLDQWGDACGDDLMNRAKSNPEDLVTILQVVTPRYDRNPNRMDSLNMPFASCYIYLERRHVIQEGGFRDFSYAVPRWAKTSGEMYGRGPGMIALPDVRTLNKADESSLEAVNLGIRPPLLANNDGVIGEIDLRPWGVTVTEGPDALRALEMGTKFDMANLFLEERRGRIRRIFFWDQLQLPNEREMTYGEVERRLELMRRILGPTISRLEYEDLNVTVGRVFGIMLRRGQLGGDPPEELQGADLDIEYEGPLAKSQRSGRLAALQQSLGLLAPLLADPEMLAILKENVNMDAMMRDVFQTAGAPSQWLADTRERDAKRKQRMEQQAAQQQLAQVEQMAGAAGKASPALKLLMGGAQGEPAQEGAA